MTKKMKIAWLSPFPPQKSGIANYSYILISELKKFADIDLYYDNQEPSEEIKEEFKIFPISELENNYIEYDEIIYHLGNNSEFHMNIYKTAWKLPGTVFLHDYNLHFLMRHAFLHTHEIVKRSKRVIVHCAWVKKQFPDNAHIKVLPHFAKVNYKPSEKEKKAFRNKYGIKDNESLISCVGFLHKNKLLDIQHAAVIKLIQSGYPVKMLFGGEISPEMKYLENEIRNGKYRNNFIFTGFLAEKEYFTSIFASDIIINLRNPSMGETSGTLMQALAAGKPVIAGDINQYKEFPDDLCWKVPCDGKETGHLYHCIKTLLSDRDLIETMSKRSLDYAQKTLGCEKITKEFLKIFEPNYR